MCPLYKTVGMMRSIVNFYDEAKRAIVESPPEAKITWATINTRETETWEYFNKLSKMKFEDPKKSEAEYKTYFNNLVSGT